VCQDVTVSERLQTIPPSVEELPAVVADLGQVSSVAIVRPGLRMQQ
jgi:hypothetical protein